MKAVCLFSGGLDSQLAAKVIQEQNINIIGLHFVSPFFGNDDKTKIAANALGIKLHIVPLERDYLEKVLKNPVYGYGKNMNPCIDCHAYMLRYAGDLMEELGASFLVTGEVLAQRPMSQNKAALNTVGKLSGYKEYIVRPLSGQLLEPTLPEKQGWIDRSQLLDISGRSRVRQIELACHYGITDYPSPAGGCLLTETNYVRRLKRILEKIPSPYPEQLEILRLGRHFYLDESHLLVIGRNHSENSRLQALAAENDLLLKVQEYPGPLGLIRSIVFHDNMDSPSEDDVLRAAITVLKHDRPLVQYAASLVARYSDAKKIPQVNVTVFNVAGHNLAVLATVPLDPDMVPLSV